MNNTTEVERLTQLSFRLPKIYGNAHKLSNYGWKTHERYFKIDHLSLSYFSSTNAEDKAKAKIGEVNPKQSVPLAYITQMSPFNVDQQKQENDYEQMKKFKALFDTKKAFKVVFHEAALCDGIYDETQFKRKNTEDKLRRSKLRTWYIQVSEPGQTAAEWIRNFYQAIGQPQNGSNSEESKQGNLFASQSERRIKTNALGDTFLVHNDEDSVTQIVHKQRETSAFLSQTESEDGGQQIRADERVKWERGEQIQLNTVKQGSLNQLEGFHKAHGDQHLGIDQQPLSTTQQRKRSTLMEDSFPIEADKNEPTLLDNMKWDLKFQNLWSLVIAADSDFQTNMTLSEKLFHLVGEYNREVSFIVTNIVDDFSQPEKDRQYFPQSKLSPKHAILLNQETHGESVFLNSDKMVYLIKGIFIKICPYGQPVNPGAKSMDNQHEPLLRKQFCREFNSVDLVSDALLFTSNVDTKYRLRTPLVTALDYKGFRAVATATLPIRPEQGMSLGFDKEGKLHELDYSLRTELEDVGTILNLAECKTLMVKHNIKQQPKNNSIYSKESDPGIDMQQFASVPISNFIKVYAQLEGVCPDIRYMSVREVEKNTRNFLKNNYIEPIQYVLKTENIFPLDFNEGRQILKDNHQVIDPDQIQVHPDRVIRQELFTNYETTIKTDYKKIIPGQLTRQNYLGLKGLKQKIKDSDETNDLNDLDDMSTQLYMTNIKTIVNLFENLEEIPLSSRQLKGVLHSYGVNMRYLGRVTSQLTQHHIKSLCMLEMLARVAKNIYNDQISKQILQSKQVCTPTSVNEWTIEFLNTLLGNSLDRQELHEILIKQAASYFKYSETELRTFELRPTALYFAFLDLTNISETGLMLLHSTQASNPQMNSDTASALHQQNVKELLVYKNLFVKEEPFGDPKTSQCRFESTPKIKTLSFEGLPYRIVSEKASQYVAEDRIEQAIKSCHMKRTFTQYTRHTDDIEALFGMCEIALAQKQWVEAIKKAQMALDILYQNLSPLHAETIQFYCTMIQAHFMNGNVQHADIYFSKALAVLDYHWGHYHPMQITIYNIMANLHISSNNLKDANFLLQSSINCCLKVLGSSHIMTAQVHTDLGKLQVRMGYYGKSLVHFKQSFHVYTHYLGENNLETAKSAFQAACILDQIGHYFEAYQYACKSVMIFADENNFGRLSIITLTAKWQKLALAYILGFQGSPLQAEKYADMSNYESINPSEVLNQAINLYADLKSKDLKVINSDISDDESVQAIDQQIMNNLDEIDKELVNKTQVSCQNVQMMVVVAIIYEITRKFDNQYKPKLKKFFLKQVSQNQHKFTREQRDSFNRHDPTRVSNLTYFKCSEQSSRILLNWYMMSEEQKDEANQTSIMIGSFPNQYRKFLEEIVGLKKTDVSSNQGLNQLLSSTKNDQDASHYSSLGAKEDVALKLLLIFEHINFFNLIQVESSQQDLASKHTVEGLYWQLGALEKEKYNQDHNHSLR